jgi:hypothetical protein
MKVARRAPGAGVRKPPREETAEGGRGWRGVDYGDLNAAVGVCDWSGVGSASWRKRKWLMNGKRDFPRTLTPAVLTDGLFSIWLVRQWRLCGS